MKDIEILENKSTREKLLGNVSVLEKVKDLLLLGNSEFATTQQVADYYEVELEAVKKLVNRNKEELLNNGLKDLTGKETKDILASDNMSITNCKGYFMVENQKMSNRNNLLFSKRAILNVGMLLRDSKVAKEIRSRLLDIEYESNNATQENGNTVKENIVNEIDEEKALIIQRVEAEMAGDYDTVCVINAKLFALKNRRIADLEAEVKDITTHSLTIIEGKQVVNRLVRVIACKEYNGNFGVAWAELYKKINYKLKINVKAREKKKSQSYLDVLTEAELFTVEEIVRTWANEVGVDIRKELKIGA